MGEITHLGLPLLTEKTYIDYVEKLRKLQGPSDADSFFTSLFEEITDPLYRKFIEDAAATYPDEQGRDTARKDLMGGHHLLSQEGALSMLDQEKFDKRWEATMNRNGLIITMNVGHNMDIIRADNPIFWQSIMDCAQCYPRNQDMFDPGPNMYIMSDLSSGYMFLADNVVRVSEPEDVSPIPSSN